MEDIWEWQNDEWRVMRMISSIGSKKAAHWNNGSRG